MGDRTRQGGAREARGGRIRGAAACVLLVLLLPAAPARADDRTPVHAQAGLAIATDAARTWAADAHLIYVENDDVLDSHGAALRWGYLFYSPALKKARVYSVRTGRIVVAEDLHMKFEAPPIAGPWIDSGEALRISDHGVARLFRLEHDGRLDTMLLMRGAIQEDDPDHTTWMLVYTAPNIPSMFVVIDASDGTVLRVWRG